MKKLDTKKEIQRIAKTIKVKSKKKTTRTNTKSPKVKLDEDLEPTAFDPRQKPAWDNYIDPRSDTFTNAYASAVKAKYSPKSALHITKTKWWKERVRRLGLFNEAEEVLESMLKLPTDIRKYSYSKRRSVDDDYEGDEEEEVGEYVITDPALVRIKQDTAKFIAERLGKNEGYSVKTEVVQSGKIDLVTGNKALDDLFEDEGE